MPGGKLTKADAEKFWAFADRDGDGELTVVELRRAVAEYCRAQGKPCPDNKNIIRMFQGIDRSGDNRISKQEFMSEMTEREEREQTFCRLFKQLDKNGDGFLSRDEIRELFKMSKCKYTPAQIEEIITAADTNHDNKISFEEFKNECT